MLGKLISKQFRIINNLDAKCMELQDGTQIGIARSVVAMLESRIGPMVMDAEELHFYLDEFGTWVQHNWRDGVEKFVQRLHGCPYGEKDSVLDMTDSRIKAVLSQIRRSLHQSDYFANAIPGIATRAGSLVATATEIKLVPYSQEHRHRQYVDFDPSNCGECPGWESFLMDLFDGDDDQLQKISILQEFLGMCLFGMATEGQKALVFLGDGANGKSTLIRTLHGLFEGYVSEVTMQRMHHEYYVARLNGVLLNMVSELSGATVHETDNAKAIFSGDAIAGRHPMGRVFSLTPKAGHIFAVNELPRICDDSPGFWRRMMVLEFNREFTGDKTQISIVNGLLAERQAIYGWMVRGAERWLRQRQYTVAESAVFATEQWKSESSHIYEFCEEMLTKKMPSFSDERGTTITDLRNVYLGYCDRLRIKPIQGADKIGSKVRVAMGIKKKPRRANGEAWLRVWARLKQ